MIGEFYELPTLVCAHCLKGVALGEWSKEEMSRKACCLTDGCTQFGVWYSWFPMICEIEPDEISGPTT